MFLNGLLHGCSLPGLQYGIICVSRHHKAVMVNDFQAGTPAGQINLCYWVLKLENNELNMVKLRIPMIC
jgi:hypothetical protein